MDGEDLFQKGMIGMGALGGVLAALVLCVGVTGIDSWALGLDEEEPEGEQPIADANGVIYVPPGDPALPWSPPGGTAGKVLIKCPSGPFGSAVLMLSGDATTPVELVVLGGELQGLVEADKAGEIEVDHGGETLIVSWPAEKANAMGACRVERKVVGQPPSGP
jgi:hypothetical protein